MSDARCEEFRELVSAFVDERLDGAELLRLEEHLRDCAGCRAFEVDLRRFGELLRAAGAFQPLRRPPPGFAAKVAARAVDRPEAQVVPFPARGRRLSVLSRLGIAAAAAAALLFFAWSWQRLLPGSRPAAQVAMAPVVREPDATTEEGNLEAWAREHVMLARGGTLLGRAEEVELASFQIDPAAGRPELSR